MRTPPERDSPFLQKGCLMTNLPTKAAVLWTGGKDCALAMHIAMQSGFDVTCLVTFAPRDAHFRSHSLDLMRAQADAIDLPWLRMEIAEPYFDSYKAAIVQLRDEHGIEVVVTGDIAEVDGYPNWVRQCAEGSGVEVATPLWGLSRAEMLDALVRGSFRVIITAVKLSALGDTWVGREIDRATADELLSLHQTRGIDACGENGEYHTMVIDAPFFARPIRVSTIGASKDTERAYAEFAPSVIP